jgi:hypothetical protein
MKTSHHDAPTLEWFRVIGSAGADRIVCQDCRRGFTLLNRVFGASQTCAVCGATDRKDATLEDGPADPSADDPAYLAHLAAHPDPDPLAEDYPGQRITGPDFDTRDREGAVADYDPVLLDAASMARKAGADLEFAVSRPGRRAAYLSSAVANLHAALARVEN